MKNKILILALAAAFAANFALADFAATADDISRATKSCDKGDIKACGALAQVYNYGWRAARSAKGCAVIHQSL